MASVHVGQSGNMGLKERDLTELGSIGRQARTGGNRLSELKEKRNAKKNKVYDGEDSESDREQKPKSKVGGIERVDKEVLLLTTAIDSPFAPSPWTNCE